MIKFFSILYWLPRVIGLIMFFVLVLMSLDVTSYAEGTKNLVLGVLLHLIPSAIFLGIFLLAWRWPLWGGLLFAVLSIIYWLAMAGTFLFKLPVGGTLALLAILFIINYIFETKAKKIINIKNVQLE